mmetsp:Transcript_23800/g.74369  ORF Transcript_23800/g.74369 Transcript_23800/m.74369 type:complete len:212 (-) Transcript_23800:52-687(-)
MFDQYESELTEVLDQAETKLGCLAASSENETRKALAKDLKSLLEAASDLSKQLDVEARSGGDARAALSERQAPLKARLRTARARFTEAREEIDRENVLGVRNPLNASAQSRGRLVGANDRLQQQNDLVRGALEIAHETEQTAIDITQELGRNRETIQSIRGHVADTSGSLGAARNLIASMQKREVQQKIVLTFVAAILVGAIGTVSYYTFG